MIKIEHPEGVFYISDESRIFSMRVQLPETKLRKPHEMDEVRYHVYNRLRFEERKCFEDGTLSGMVCIDDCVETVDGVLRVTRRWAPRQCVTWVPKERD